jgi:hypothetical protein
VTVPSPQPDEGTALKREMQTRAFTGPTLEDAKRLAKETLGAALLSTEIVRDIHAATATAQGRIAEETLREAEKRIPAEALEREPARLVQEGQTGTTEVTEFDEREARKVWRKTAPRGAQIDAIECTVPAKNGLMGIGKRPATYTVRWSAPYVAEAAYTMPAVVNAMFWG